MFHSVRRRTTLAGDRNAQYALHIVRTPLAPADRMGSTESNCTRIVVIGCRGCGREKRSGENSPRE